MLLIDNERLGNAARNLAKLCVHQVRKVRSEPDRTAKAGKLTSKPIPASRFLQQGLVTRGRDNYVLRIGHESLKRRH